MAAGVGKGQDRAGLSQAARFAVASCELRDGELIVTGVWSGVRGLRFVRPTLLVDDRSVLATLEHKPWDPATDPWIAAFPWAGDEPDPQALRLSVAPQITVDLGAGGAVIETEPARFTRDRERDNERERARAEAERDDALNDRARALAEIEELRAAERAAAGRAEAHRRDAETARNNEQDAIRERDDALARAASAERDRDEARRSAEHERAAREQAEAETRRLQTERDAAVREHDRARSAAAGAEERAQDAERRAEHATVTAVRARDALAAAAREIPVPEDAGEVVTRTLPAPVAPALPTPVAHRRTMAGELASARALWPARLVAGAGVLGGFILLLKLIS